MSAFSQALLFIGLALGFGSSLPGAHAQTAGTSGSNTISNSGGVSVQAIDVGGRKFTDLTQGISKTQCDGNENIRFTLNGIPPSTTYIEVWTGVNCTAGNRSNRIDSAPCVSLYSKENNIGQTVVSIDVPAQPLCDQGEGARDLFFLPVPSQNYMQNVTTYGQLTLNVDKSPPTNVTSVKAGGGATEIHVTWSASSGSPIRYWILLDPMGSEGSDDADGGTADCSSTELALNRVDIDPGNPPAGIRAFSKEGQYTDNFDLNTEELRGSMLGALTVVAQDYAGNFSPIAQVVCARVIKTTGFWDAYKASGGDAEQGCNCSVPGATGGRSLLGVLALSGLAIAYGMRRARSRR